MIQFSARKMLASVALLTGLMWISQNAQGQTPVSPEVPQSGATLQAFVPSGWSIRDTVRGEISVDGIEDAVIVIEQLPPGAARPDPSADAPARVLLVLFGDEATGFQRAIQAIDFVMKADEGGVFGDPYQDMTIKNGVFQINFYGGSSWRWGYSYQFRYQSGEFALIGATATTNNVNTGEASENSYNFLTKKMRASTFNSFNDKVKEKVRWQKIPIDRLKTLDNMPHPGNWTVMKDCIL